MTTNSKIDEAQVGTQWKIEDLTPFPENAKVHTELQISQLAKSIEEFKWTTRILVDQHGTVINGHGRLMAAKELGLKTVPVTVRDDLTPEKIRALRLIDNRVSDTSYDQSLLKDELAFLADMDVGIDDFFSEAEMSFAIDDIEIDMDALSNNLAGEVEEKSRKTQDRMEEDEIREVPLRKVFDFNKVSVREQRVIKLFMAHIEGETGLVGSAAMVAFAQDYVGIN